MVEKYKFYSIDKIMGENTWMNILIQTVAILSIKAC